MIDFVVIKEPFQLKYEQLINFKNEFIGQYIEIFNKEKLSEMQSSNSEVLTLQFTNETESSDAEALIKTNEYEREYSAHRLFLFLYNDELKNSIPLNYNNKKFNDEYNKRYGICLHWLRIENRFIVKKFGQHFENVFTENFTNSNGKINFFSVNQRNQEELAFSVDEEELRENQWKKFNYKGNLYLIAFKEYIYGNSDINNKSIISGKNSVQCKSLKSQANQIRIFSIKEEGNEIIGSEGEDDLSDNKSENENNRVSLELQCKQELIFMAQGSSDGQTLNLANSNPGENFANNNNLISQFSLNQIMIENTTQSNTQSHLLNNLIVINKINDFKNQINDIDAANNLNVIDNRIDGLEENQQIISNLNVENNSIGAEHDERRERQISLYQTQIRLNTNQLNLTDSVANLKAEIEKLKREKKQYIIIIQSQKTKLDLFENELNISNCKNAEITPKIRELEFQLQKNIYDNNSKEEKIKGLESRISHIEKESSMKISKIEKESSISISNLKKECINKTGTIQCLEFSLKESKIIQQEEKDKSEALARTMALYKWIEDSYINDMTADNIEENPSKFEFLKHRILELEIDLRERNEQIIRLKNQLESSNQIEDKISQNPKIKNTKIHNLLSNQQRFNNTSGLVNFRNDSVKSNKNLLWPINNENNTVNPDSEQLTDQARGNFPVSTRNIINNSNQGFNDPKISNRVFLETKDKGAFATSKSLKPGNQQEKKK